MSTEPELETWEIEADSTFEEVRHLDRDHQLRILDSKSKEVQDDAIRTAFLFRVFNLIKENENSSSPPKSIVEKTFAPDGAAFVAFVLTFLVFWWEFGVRFLYSICIAFGVALLIRFLFRMFDRNFLFRRLFQMWTASGIVLLVAPPISVLLETAIGTVSWGGPPSIPVISVWAVGFLVSAPLAYLESRDAN
ncbi:hypothetical protein LP7551_05291 [Roseibium album]|nr:hypothetical protein LP7551_05291 [Roseibium album]